MGEEDDEKQEHDSVDVGVAVSVTSGVDCNLDCRCSGRVGHSHLALGRINLHIEFPRMVNFQRCSSLCLNHFGLLGMDLHAT